MPSTLVITYVPASDKDTFVIVKYEFPSALLSTPPFGDVNVISFCTPPCVPMANTPPAHTVKVLDSTKPPPSTLTNGVITGFGLTFTINVAVLLHPFGSV